MRLKADRQPPQVCYVRRWPPHLRASEVYKNLPAGFFFFFKYSSQTPSAATGRIVGLSGGGARIHSADLRSRRLHVTFLCTNSDEREMKEQSGMDESKKGLAGVRC